MKLFVTDEDKIFIICNKEKMTWGRMSKVSPIPRSILTTFYKKWIATKKIGNLKRGKPTQFAINLRNLNVLES